MAARWLLGALAIAASAAADSTECELTTGRTLTVIKSLRFPEPYGPNVDCRYTVRRRSEAVCSVTFLFNVFDLDLSPGCARDHLLFEETGEKLCGAKPVGFSRTLSFMDSSSPTPEVVMKFHSGNGTHGGLGYMITVVQQECPRPSCNSVHDEVEFSLISPNYPLPYENGQTCKFTIHKSSPYVCRLSLMVHSFELEEDEHCQADFLQLNDDNRLCGKLNPGQIVEVNFFNDTTVFEFQSDHYATKNGFQLVVHQEECNASVTDQTEMNTISSETTVGNLTLASNETNNTSPPATMAESLTPAP